MKKMYADVKNIVVEHYRLPEGAGGVLFMLSKLRGPLADDLFFLYLRKHKRFSDEQLSTHSVHSRGGKTVVAVEWLDDSVTTGVAYCSLSDNYCYRIGREIALGRALAKRVK